MEPMVINPIDKGIELINLNIQFPEGKIINMNAEIKEPVFEIHQQLLEDIEFFYLPPFHFENNNNKLNELMDLESLGINSQNNNISIVIEPYNYKSMLFHFNKFKAFSLGKINSQPVDKYIIQQILKHYENVDQVVKEAVIEQCQELELSGMIQEDKPIQAQRVIQMVGIEKEIKRMSENARQKVQEIPTNLNKLIQHHQYPELFDSITEINSIHPQYKCIENILHLNDDKQDLIKELKGDIMNIKLNTIEGNTYFITGTSQGFYVNQTENNSNNPFNSNPLLINGKIIFTKSLHYLCSILSPKYVEAYTNFKNKSGLYLSPPVLGAKKLWFRKTIFSDENENKLNEPTKFRDWNEEIQSCKRLQTDSYEIKIQKDKNLFKSYNDFVNVATEIAKLIIEKKLSFFNVNDIDLNQLFVYNNIFFNFCEDTFMTFSESPDINEQLCYTAANLDLLGLSTLNKLEIGQVSLGYSCIISYKGKRLIAQTIIPGVLNSIANLQGNTSSFLSYGSIEETKSFKTNEIYNNILKDICEKIGLEKTDIYDSQENKITIYGPYNIKGIKGTDNRNYLVDQMRLFPRDINYLESKYSLCLYRPELLNHYFNNLAIKNTSEKVHELKKRSEALEEMKGTQEEELKRLEELQIINNEISSEFTKSLLLMKQSGFNVNLYTDAKIADNSEKIKKSEERLKDLNNFFLEILKQAFLSEIYQTELNPLDSESTSEILHSNGINIRYLGQIANNQKDPVLIYLKNDLIRIILVRTLKHIIIKYIKEANQNYLIPVLCHFLNLVFSPIEVLHSLEEKKINYEVPDFNLLLSAPNMGLNEYYSMNSNKEKESEEKNGSKKKKKKNKKKNQKEGKQIKENSDNNNNDYYNGPISIKIPSIFSKTPSEIWNEIKEAAHFRYKFDFEESIFNCILNNDTFDITQKKMLIIRDLCKSIGIQLLSRNYILSNQNKKECSESLSLPFKCSDFLGFFPVVKKVNILNQDGKNIFDLAKRKMASGKLKSAFSDLATSLNIYYAAFGLWHSEIAMIAMKMAEIMHSMKSFNQALELKKIALNVIQNLNGNDYWRLSYIYFSIGLTIMCLQRFNEAFSYIYKSISILKLIIGDNHPEVCSMYLNIGMIYQEYEKYDEALEVFKISLEKFIQILGQENISVAKSYQLIANTYFYKREFREALRNEEASYHILKRILPEKDPRIEMSFNSMREYTTYSVSEEKRKNIVAKLNKEDSKSPRIEERKKRIVTKQFPTFLDILEYNMKQKRQKDILKELKDSKDAKDAKEVKEIKDSKQSFEGKEMNEVKKAKKANEDKQEN